MDEFVRKWKEMTWQVHPSLEMPEMDPAAVQFAIVNSDAAADFRQLLTEKKSQFRSELESEKDPVNQQFLKRAQIVTTWESLFRKTPGDQIYLLASSQTLKKLSPIKTVVLSSNTPGGRKWLATKVAYLDERPICWCVPLDLAIGSSVRVELKKENVIDLVRQYGELIDEP